MRMLVQKLGLICGLLVAVSAPYGWAAGERWIPLALMNDPRQEVGVAELDGKIYVIGGYRGDTSTADTVEVYDTKTNRWRTVAPLPQALNHVAAVSVEGKIYAIGGLPLTAATYEYDPERDRWTAKAPMPTARGALAAVVIDGKIYAVGGAGRSGAVADLEVYDPSTNTWRTLRPLPA